MAKSNETGKYARIAAGTGGVLAALGAVGLALNGEFASAANATQASIGLLGLSGYFSMVSNEAETETPEAVLVPVAVTINHDRP